MAGPVRAAWLVGAALSVAAAGARAGSLDSVESASSVLAFFDASAHSGARAARAREPDGRIAAVRGALVDAWDHVARGETTDACEALEVARRDADATTPPVLASGALPVLRIRLVALMAELGCFDDPSTR